MAINKVTTFIMVFIALIVGIVLLNATADSIYTATNYYTHTNESMTIASGTATTTDDDVVSIAFFGNSTENSDLNWTIAATASSGGDINWTRAGVITTNITAGIQDGAYNITYDYERDEYVVHSQARTLIRLINIFFALAILATALWGMYEMGIFDIFTKE